jgi:hypothetical protein
LPGGLSMAARRLHRAGEAKNWSDAVWPGLHKMVSGNNVAMMGGPGRAKHAQSRNPRCGSVCANVSHVLRYCLTIRSFLSSTFARHGPALCQTVQLSGGFSPPLATCCCQGRAE